MIRVATSSGQKSGKFDQKNSKIAENSGNKNGKSGKKSGKPLFRKSLSSQKYFFCNTEMTVL